MIIALLGLIIMAFILFSTGGDTQTMKYSEVIDYFEQGKVSEFVLNMKNGAMQLTLTEEATQELLESRGPRSIRIATLLDKPSRRKVDLQADYIGFSVPDEFVIGYGLDYDEKYRNLPYIGILKPEVYSV